MVFLAVDNLSVRRQLFTQVPGSYESWLDVRNQYTNSVLNGAVNFDLASEHNRSNMLTRAARALDFLAQDDDRRVALNSICLQVGSKQ